MQGTFQTMCSHNPQPFHPSLCPGPVHAAAPGTELTKGGIPQVHFYWKLWDNQNMDVIVLSIPIHTHGIRTWMINLISWKWTMCGFGFLFVK